MDPEINAGSAIRVGTENVLGFYLWRSDSCLTCRLLPKPLLHMENAYKGCNGFQNGDQYLE